MQQATTTNLQRITKRDEEKGDIPRERGKKKEEGGMVERFPSLEEALGRFVGLGNC